MEHRTTAKSRLTLPKTNVLRSKKLLWIIGTLAVVASALSFYYLVYVSSQQAYYTERSFRLLSSMADKLVLKMDNVRNVLAAAASQGTVDRANEYVERSLHGTLEPRNFVINDVLKGNPGKPTSHEGLLTLFLPDTTGGSLTSRLRKNSLRSLKSNCRLCQPGDHEVVRVS